VFLLIGVDAMIFCEKILLMISQNNCYFKTIFHRPEAT